MKKLWKDFASFRLCLGKALKDCDAPNSLIEEVNYIDNEGEGVADALFQGYEAAQDIINEDPSDSLNWEDAIHAPVHDTVIEVVCAYKNPWNYAPGHKTQPINEKELAEKVVKYLMKKLD